MLIAGAYRKRVSDVITLITKAISIVFQRYPLMGIIIIITIVISVFISYSKEKLTFIPLSPLNNFFSRRLSIDSRCLSDTDRVGLSGRQLWRIISS